MADCNAQPGGLTGGLNEYLGRLRAEAFERNIPFKAVFELTPRCNFNCAMCYVHLKPEEIPAVGRELTTQEWLRVGRQAQEAGTLELTLTGGEPFVRPDFPELYEAFHDMGFFIQIFSNGSLIDAGTVRWLARRPPKAVRFTLYGASDASYEAVCGVRGGLSRVSESVRLLRDAKIPVYLAATVTRENAHELDDMYRFAHSLGLPMIHTDSLVPPVRGASADAKAHEALRRLPPPDVIRALRARGDSGFPRKPCTDYLSVCGNYRRAFWVTWSGRMQLCAFLTEPSFCVLDAPLSACWDRLLDSLAHLRQPEECGRCAYEQYCKRCPGILYAESGSAERTAPSVCEQAEFHYNLYGKPLENDEV